MGAAQSVLFQEYPEATDIPFEGWRERAAHLQTLCEKHGGLVPVSAVPDILGVHKSRVHQLIETGALELVQYGSVHFVSGRSLDAWEKADKARGGRGRRRLGIWGKVVVSFKVGSAASDSIL